MIKLDRDKCFMAIAIFIVMITYIFCLTATAICITDIWQEALKPIEEKAETPVKTEPDISEPVISKPVVQTVREYPTNEPAKKQEPQSTTVNDSDATYIAKTVFGEARGLSKVEQAAVIWCILNRVDNGSYPNTIAGVVTQANQFHGYSPGHPVDSDIYSLTQDVLNRWQSEKNGERNVGRVLPKQYVYFYGDGSANHYTDSWRGGNKWDWSLENPYA